MPYTYALPSADAASLGLAATPLQHLDRLMANGCPISRARDAPNRRVESTSSLVRRAGVRPLSTVEQGARAILNLATSAALEGQTGLYFNGLREAKAQAQAYDADGRRRLRALSLELTGLSAEGITALDR
jgi:hypothetical protein